MKKNKFISFKNVFKSFGDNHVLKDLNLDISMGESLTLIGQSGTGKSVLLKCLLGLLKTDRGQILLDGEDVTHLGRIAHENYLKNFAMLFQGSALFDSLSIVDNVAFGLVYGQGMSPHDARDIAMDAIVSVGLNPDIAYLQPTEISGGMQKRVAFARAMVLKPRIILFDEPTAGLDPIVANTINDLIIYCRHELKLTVITITHDMRSLMAISDRVAMLYQGQIIWEGGVNDVDHSGHPIVDQFTKGYRDGPLTPHLRPLKV